MAHKDRYASFAELRLEQREGHDYRVVTVSRPDSPFAIVAPHGGSIEAGTSELAAAIAGDDLSLALFEGVKRNSNQDLHITSHRFDEPRCVEVVLKVETAIALHGEGGDARFIYMGGADAELRGALSEALLGSGFLVRVHDDPALQGIAPANICNRGRSGSGVQLELARGLRAAFFESLSREGRRAPTPGFNAFVAAVRKGLGYPLTCY